MQTIFSLNHTVKWTLAKSLPLRPGEWCMGFAAGFWPNNQPLGERWKFKLQCQTEFSSITITVGWIAWTWIYISLYLAQILLRSHHLWSEWMKLTRKRSQRSKREKSRILHNVFSVCFDVEGMVIVNSKHTFQNYLLWMSPLPCSQITKNHNYLIFID